MSAKTYRKKPVTVQALQWKGNNFTEISDFVGSFTAKDGISELGVRIGVFSGELRLWVAANSDWLWLEIGEWVLKDQLGYYPCQNKMFEYSYEEDKS